VNEKERYLLDLQGYLVVENVLNKEQLEALNRALDEKVQTEQSLQDFFFWDEPTFRDLITDPVIKPYLSDIIGQHYRLDHEYGIYHKKGAPPLHLHGGGTPYDPGQYYHVRNEKMYCGLTVISYALTDIGQDDGGFCCITGSHKSNFSCPQDFKNFSDDAPIVHIPQKAGDVLIFTEALTHGTFPWQGNHERRSLLYKYSPAAISWGTYDRTPELLDRLTPEQRHVLAMPANEWVRSHIYRESQNK